MPGQLPVTDNIHIADANQKDIDFLKKNLCQENHDECWAMLHICGGCGLQLSYDCSFLSKIIFYKHVPVLAFGAIRQDEKKAVAWLMASYELKHVILFALKQLMIFIDIVSNEYETIENFVDVRHKQMIKFIKLCGFNLDNPVKKGVEQMLFQRFWYVRGI